MRLLVPSLALATLASAALAQGGPCTFTIDQSASTFSWTATTSLGPLVGNPGNTFQLAGTADVDLATAGHPFSTGQFAGGVASLVGGFHGIVPNPVPIFPPLAKVDATNVTATVESTVFQDDGAGNFGADFTLTTLTGDVVVDVLGTQTLLSLVDTASDPATSAGTFSLTATHYELSLPIDVTLPIDDPNGLISGSFTITGTLAASAPIGTGCETTFFADPPDISLLAGGTQTMTLDVGPALANELYWVLGSVTGTSPGLPGPPPLPLEPDFYFFFTFDNPNTLIQGSLFFLDAAGQGLAALTIGPGDLDPSFAGLVLHHAYVVLDGALDPLAASNATSLTLVP
jgi:hypothetical protein